MAREDVLGSMLELGLSQDDISVPERILSKPIKAVFFDIGGTLGAVDVGTKFPETINMLKIIVTVFRLPAGVNHQHSRGLDDGRRGG